MSVRFDSLDPSKMLLGTKEVQKIHLGPNEVWAKPVPPSGVSARYVRWRITKRRGTANSIQFAELNLKLSGAAISYAGVAATGVNDNTPPAETADMAIDGDSATKWLDFNFDGGGSADKAQVTGESILELDAGVGNTLDFDSYSFTTANDAEERDPVSWELQSSDDGTNWTVEDAQSDQTITTTRETETQDWSLV